MTDCASLVSDYRLTFANTFVGDSVVDWYSSYKRATEIAITQGFRAPAAIQDGRYPAPVLVSTFEVYIERATPRDYHKTFFGIFATFVTSDPMPLQLVEAGTNSPYASFGNCYMLPMEQKEPSGILLHRAGIVKVSFQGTRLTTIF